VIDEVRLRRGDRLSAAGQRLLTRGHGNFLEAEHGSVLLKSVERNIGLGALLRNAPGDHISASLAHATFTRPSAIFACA
jgi:hypothetical protein